MARISYEQARKDHEYLWSIAPANDMTGGYVDQEDLRVLLKSPTKATARRCYERQIEYWFQIGPENDQQAYTAAELIDRDPQVREIAIRHGFAAKEDARHG